MGSLFGTMMDKLNPPEKQRILMIGLDAAGKTTILYKLFGNKVVTTIPTIGFNVETVTYKNLEFTTWDVGPGKIRPLWRHYMQNTMGLIFVVDSSDTDRMSHEHEGSASYELHWLLQEPDLKDVAVLIFANKQDFYDALPLEAIQDRLMMTQWVRHSTELLTSLGKETHLKLLPESIINILSEYTEYKQCGPCPLQEISAHHLDKVGLMTKGHWGVCNVICEYLPPYRTNGTQKKCHIQGSCAPTAEGLYEGLDWLSQAMSEQKAKEI